MAVYVKNLGAWRSPAAGSLMYYRAGGKWYPILDMWVKGNPTPGSSALPVNTFVEPFNALTNWTTGSPSLVTGRNGQGLRADGNTQGAGTLHTLPSAQQSDTVTVGLAFMATTYTGDSHVLSLCGDAGATTHVVITLGTARDVYAWRGTVTPLGQTTSHAAFPAAGTWFYVEVQAKLHDTTGYVIVHINGTEVLNLQNQDTKNAGTGVVFDSLRVCSGNQFNQPAAVDDLYLTPSAIFLGDIGDASNPPVNPPTSTDHAWHEETTYNPTLVTPSTPTISPSASANYANHDTIPIAWTYTGVLPPGDFVIAVNDSTGKRIQTNTVAGTARTYTCTGLTQGVKYAVYVMARYPGGRTGTTVPDTAWSQPLRWALGTDATTTNGAAVYVWGDQFEWTPNLGVPYATGAASSTFPWGAAIDNNANTVWISPEMPEPTGGNQGEGIQLNVTTGHYMLVGAHVTTFYPHTVWMGVYYNHAWQGSQVVYASSGKYALWMSHVYSVGVGGSADMVLNCPNYVTDAAGAMQVAFLFQVPSSYAGFGLSGLRCSCREIKLQLQRYIFDHYTQVPVPAVNSGTW